MAVISTLGLVRRSPRRAGLICCVSLGCGGTTGTERGAGAADEPKPEWVLPEGGVAVDSVPLGGAELKSVDAFGNLWLQGCEGLFVVSRDGIRRYRYLDAPSQYGSAILRPDRRGRMWLAASGHVSMVEAGQWQDLWVGDYYGIVVGSDGTAWLRHAVGTDHGLPGGDQTIQRLWPELGAAIEAPGWGNAVFPGRNGAVWYATLEDELYRYERDQFWGPYAMSPTNIHYHYDSLDDAFGLSGSSRLTKVRFEGEIISEVGQWDISWSSALGRLADGDLAVRDRNDRVVVMDGHASADERVVASIDGEIALGTPVLSPIGELYFGTGSAVYHYREGGVEVVLELSSTGVIESEPRPYGRALREEASAATRADFEPFVPFEVGAKVRVTAGIRGSLAEGAGFDIDGESVSATLAVAPELAAFVTERGIGRASEDDVRQLWELIGYLEPAPCYDSGNKLFQIVEAYPVSIPAEERLLFEQELRRRYPE